MPGRAGRPAIPDWPSRICRKHGKTGPARDCARRKRGTALRSDRRRCSYRKPCWNLWQAPHHTQDRDNSSCKSTPMRLLKLLSLYDANTGAVTTCTSGSIVMRYLSQRCLKKQRKGSGFAFFLWIRAWAVLQIPQNRLKRYQMGRRIAILGQTHQDCLGFHSVMVILDHGEIKENRRYGFAHLEGIDRLKCRWYRPQYSECGAARPDRPI